MTALMERRRRGRPQRQAASRLRAAPSTSDRPPKRPGAPRVAYVVSRFPRLTETFVVDEVVAVRRAGAAVDLYPLHREPAAVVQPLAKDLAPYVHHHRLLDRSVLASQWHVLRATPKAYVFTAVSVIRHNLGSRRLLMGAVASFPYAVHLARQFRADGIDHVHAHFATHPAVVAYVIHRLAGIPFSFTAHGSDLHRDRHMLAEKVRRAAFVVVISESNRQVVLDECGSEVIDRIVVVHCGVDRLRFPRRERTTPDLGDTLRVCCVGTLHPVKGQTHLVEACRRLRAAGVDIELTLVGDGPDRSALEDQVTAAGIGDAVHFTGPLTQPEVQTILAGCNVLAAPSVPTPDGRREGLPVAILEAMAAGLAVVASRLSGIPEAVIHERTGLLVEPGDVDDLALALQRLHQEPDLVVRLTDAAFDHVAAEFDQDRSAERLVALFDGSSQ